MMKRGETVPCFTTKTINCHCREIHILKHEQFKVDRVFQCLVLCHTIHALTQIIQIDIHSIIVLRYKKTWWNIDIVNWRWKYKTGFLKMHSYSCTQDSTKENKIIKKCNSKMTRQVSNISQIIKNAFIFLNIIFILPSYIFCASLST